MSRSVCAGQPLQEAGIRISAIDHFGLHDPTPLQAEDSYEHVCERYRSGSLMAVSDRTPKDWYAFFPNPVLPEGALDRLINSSHYVLTEHQGL